MTAKTIELFMWGFQEHFRLRLQLFTKETLAKIGIECEPEVLLVGIKKQDSNAFHPVCIEPEYQKWDLDIFDGIIQKINDAYEQDPNHKIIYGNDEIAMQEKPERIMRSCITSAISQALAIYDGQNDTKSFCGTAYPVNNYYVVPIIQIDSRLIAQLPSVELELYDYYSRKKYNYNASLLKSCITEVLEQATIELAKPHPGRGILDTFSKTNHIIPLSATYFVSTLYRSIHSDSIQNGRHEYISGETLFDDLNKISSLSYEGQNIEGKLIICNLEDDSVDFYLRFKDEVSIKDYRWMRKLLHMTTKDISLVSDGVKIYGLGCLKKSNANAIESTLIIEFLDHYNWCLYHQNKAIIRCTYEAPSIPKSIIDQELFMENFSRIFPKSSIEHQRYIWCLVSYAFQDLSGCMLMIVDDIENESKRLANQSTPIEPTLLTQELLTRVRRIDGSILLDYTGMCYAIGVILDGEVNSRCTPSRGSRFNSAMRYVYGQIKRTAGRLAIIISDDKSVEVEPFLHPRISETELEEYITGLEEADADNYREYQRWLDNHRFYINEDRCKRINNALIRIEELPYEDTSFRYIESEFVPNEEMENEYFK